jgi:TolB-like protein
MALATKSIKTAIAVFTSTCLSAVASAQSPGSLESGIATLAEDIAKKNSDAGMDTIAILPFPNTDGSCSVLSVLVVDELIQSMFSVPRTRLKIVERAQLERIIGEHKFAAEGLLDPKTVQRFGMVSGVKGLTIGSLTSIGDQVRINARLIATETGHTVSAAAVTIPRTNAVAELMAKPLATGPLCSRTQTASASAQGTSASAASEPAAPSRTAQGIRASLERVGKAGHGGTTFGLVLTNVTDKPVKIIALSFYEISPILTRSTGEGRTGRLVGMPTCEGGSGQRVDRCLTVPNWLELDKGGQVSLSATFNDSYQQGQTAGLSVQVLVAKESTGQPKSYATATFFFSSIPLP